MTGAAEPLRVLYISYDGLLEPLGQSQIMPYVEGLRARHVAITLLTFEKPGDQAAADAWRALGERLAGLGIAWTPLQYHKAPTLLATLYDVVRGMLVGARLVRRHRIQIVHARSYVAAAVALVLQRLLRVRFLFDMRGFWPDERVDAHIWPRRGLRYRLAKAFEKILLTRADEIISLTDAGGRAVAGLDYLRPQTHRITVIPTCVDLARFRPASRPPGWNGDGAWDGRFTLVYSGSLGTWYDLDAMAAFFRILKRRRRHARFVILTPGAPTEVEAVRRKHGLAEEEMSAQRAPHARVPGLIATADAGIMLSAPSWSNTARCPTKLAEFLASGVPVIVSRGIGDTEEIVRGERVGVIVEALGTPAYEHAAEAFEELRGDVDLGERCRRVAERHFALGEGVARYERVYRRMAGVSVAPAASDGRP